MISPILVKCTDYSNDKYYEGFQIFDTIEDYNDWLESSKIKESKNVMMTSNKLSMDEYEIFLKYFDALQFGCYNFFT